MFRTILDIVLICLGILIAQRLGVLRATVEKGLKSMEQAIARLRASVSSQAAVIAGASTLLAGLAQQIRDASDDPEQLIALADQIDAQTGDLSKAIAENTNAAGEIPADPTKVAGTDTAVGQQGSNAGGEEVELEDTTGAAGAGIAGRTEGAEGTAAGGDSTGIAVGTGATEAGGGAGEDGSVARTGSGGSEEDGA